MPEILLVEDSTVQREFIRKRILSRFPTARIRVASDPFEAREEIAKRPPDLMLLDIELPKMSGAEFLGHVMRSFPLPVIVVTGTVKSGSDRWEKLKRLGCHAVIGKPAGCRDHARFDSALFDAIASAVKLDNCERMQGRRLPICHPDKSIIGIGSSTGGPKALEVVLAGLDATAPPVVIAQHISARFAKPLVDTLALRTKLHVKLGEDGETLQSGVAYICTPGYNTRVVRGMRLALEEADPNCRFSPNVDILFQSLSTLREMTIAAALLTGMGDDGAKGLLALSDVGALTIAQDEQSCVVYGMPARAAELGAASWIVPLKEVSSMLTCWYNNHCPSQIGCETIAPV